MTPTPSPVGNVQTGSSFKNITLTGGDASNFNIIGNTNQYNNLTVPKFSEVNLEEFNQGNFPTPKQEIIDKFINIIEKTGLLVLGGSNQSDKASLARYLAWKLKSYRGANQPILEWERSSEPKTIDLEFQKAKEPTIYILNEVSPQNIGYSLSRIQKAAASNRHYVVATTDTPLVRWKLTEEEKQEFWIELDLSSDSYTEEVLFKELLKKLKEAGESLQQVLRKESVQDDDPVVGTYHLQVVTKQLKTPAQIAYFVQLLDKKVEEEKEVVKTTIVVELINKIKANKDDHEQLLKDWYYHSLDYREQLLALGLNFFDGLFDDQFFRGLEEVVKNAWQKRDEKLRAIDYCDLDNLGNFFKLNPPFEVEEAEVRTIESCFPKQRRMLFKLAWNSHRRQILAALETIVELVKLSVANRSFGQELYGTRVRREQLRRVLGEAISDIGWISPIAIQDTLRQLAADREIDVQAVAAYAMARWRDSEYGRDKELFETLHNWQDNDRLISQIKSLLNDQDETQSQEPQDYIRATIALTVGYAALYDPPNELHPKLYELLQKLSEETNQLVRDRFGFYTLRMVVPLHFVQLRDMLREMTQHPDLVVAISASLALAYRENPDEVLKTLNSWQKKCLNSIPTRWNAAELTPRETMLATVARTYGLIKYDEGVGTLTINEGFNNLQSIIKQEKHPYVRKVISLAIDTLTNRYFEQVEEQLKTLVANIRYDERKKIVKTLTKVYLKQRENLKGGNAEIEIDNRRYRVWMDSTKRPKTAVEEAMLRWVKDDTNAISQQVATQASVNFVRVLDQEEEKWIEEQKQPKAQIVPVEVVFQPISSGELQSGFYLNQIVTWLATRNAEYYRPTIRHVLPEAVNQHQSGREAMNFVLNRWLCVRDDQVKTISGLLTRGIWWTERFPLFIFLGAGTLLILGAIVWNGVGTAWNAISPNQRPNSSNSNPTVSTVTPSQKFEVQSSPKPTNFDNPFNNVRFPLNECGDPLPTNPSAYPLDYYPIFLNYNENNLEVVKSNLCRDAFPKTRLSGERSIQVASFPSKERAEAFLKFVETKHPGGKWEIGQPNRREFQP
jgi:hypothetical protein